MTVLWHNMPLGAVLRQRLEAPDESDLLENRVRIIEKIGFDEGRISLRSHGSTKTEMILARPGDLVISGINASKGAIAIHNIPGGAPIAATIHYSAYSVETNKADCRFLWWMLRSNLFRHLLTKHVPGGIKTELKASRLLRIPVPLPTLKEQISISSHLDTVSEEINNAKRLRKEAIEERALLTAKLVDAVFAPFEQSVVKIGEVFRVTTGGTPKRNDPSYWNGDVNWVSSGEVAFCTIRETFEKITMDGVNNSNAKVYPPFTVLLAMIGQGKTRGQCAILDCYASTNQNVAAIHVYETEHSPQYVYRWLLANYQKSRAIETGTAQPALSAERVKQMSIPLPSPAEQRRVVAELDRLQTDLDSLERAQTESAYEVDTLLAAILDTVFQSRA